MLKINCERKSIVIFIQRWICVYLSSDETFLVIDISTYMLPSFLLIFETQTNWKHSFLKQRMLFDHIHDIESDTSAFLVSEAKEKPVVITSSICIILNH
jgi:hypothetical protein